jgi:ABC-type proline/glycine betaine transport system permease subunit
MRERVNPGARPKESAMNNTSMFTADRMTHLKIVVVALICATMVAAIGVTARMASADNGRLEATVIKTGAPVTAASEMSQIR